MSDSSAVAFPRLLGIELSSINAPRLHSFAWNLGVRPEPRVDQLDFTAFLTFTESERLVEVYFKTVHPVYDFIDRQSFTELWRSRFLLRSEKRDIDSVICGVAALGKGLGFASQCQTTLDFPFTPLANPATPDTVLKHSLSIYRTKELWWKISNQHPPDNLYSPLLILILTCPAKTCF